jgi:cytochrome b561
MPLLPNSGTARLHHLTPTPVLRPRKPIPFFGLEFSSLITENNSLAKPLKKLHETIGSAAYLLIGMHAAAALFHHYVRGDNSLRKMLPERS